MTRLELGEIYITKRTGNYLRCITKISRGMVYFDSTNNKGPSKGTSANSHSISIEEFYRTSTYVKIYNSPLYKALNGDIFEN